MRRAILKGLATKAATLTVITAVLAAPWLLTIGAPPSAASIGAGALADTALPASAAKDITLKVYDHDQKKIVDMPLEEYVACVVAGEVPYEYADEAIKAQAVAARTYALYRAQALGGRGMSLHPGADVCTESAHAQAYRPPVERKRQWGSAYKEKETRLQALIAATRGLIMTYGGEPIEALYHSTSGGMTEDARNVFAVERPYLKSVVSRGEEGTKRFEAAKTLSRKDFARTVNSAYKQAGLSESKLEKQVAVLARTDAGRIDKIRLGGATLTGREFRALFGLDSANADISLGKKDVTLSTVGYGHGVGMSQTGAQAMAAEGASYDAILRHYYTGVEIEVAR